MHLQSSCRYHQAWRAWLPEPLPGRSVHWSAARKAHDARVPNPSSTAWHPLLLPSLPASHRAPVMVRQAQGCVSRCHEVPASEDTPLRLVVVVDSAAIGPNATTCDRQASLGTPFGRSPTVLHQLHSPRCQTRGRLPSHPAACLQPCPLYLAASRVGGPNLRGPNAGRHHGHTQLALCGELNLNPELGGPCGWQRSMLALEATYGCGTNASSVQAQAQAQIGELMEQAQELVPAREQASGQVLAPARGQASG